MTPECAIDLFQILPPIADFTEGIEPAIFAYTPKQREWWLRVFSSQCAFPVEFDDGGIRSCGRSENLEVHHIQPDAWTRAQEPWQDPNDTAGILLCRAHHNGTIHPDIGEARDNYWCNQDSFAEALTKHKELARRGDIFWNDDFDEMLRAVSEEAVQRYMQDNPHDHYPEDVSWGKKPHPKKKRWYDGI